MARPAANPIERGSAGLVPFAAVGSGRPVVICAGLWPTTGVASDAMVRGALAPMRTLAGQRRLIVLNRRAAMATDTTMGDIAGEYAAAIRAAFEPPVDVLGLSTGGSIAQQLAADHPDVVERLVLVSTAARLGPFGRELQARVARRLRAGQLRSALGLAAAHLAPPGLRWAARTAGWAAARRVLADPQSVADLAATLEAEDGFDLARCAQPIRARTLIVTGGRDRFYGADLPQQTAALIPGSRVAAFPRRGHITVTSDRRAQATIVGFLSAGRPQPE